SRPKAGCAPVVICGFAPGASLGKADQQSPASSNTRAALRKFTLQEKRRARGGASWQTGCDRHATIAPGGRYFASGPIQPTHSYNIHMNKPPDSISARTLHTPVLPPLPERIRLLVNDAYAARGGANRMTLDDWRDAEQEVKQRLENEWSNVRH